MPTDARSLDNNHIIEADICIIGAGPAGSLLANQFAGSGIKVAMLESGGVKSDFRTQMLSSGEVTGDFVEPVAETHLRQLGGTANHWIIKMSDKQYGYRYAPLSPIDFEQRDCVPNSGWPISRADLDPYYERIHEICQVGPYRYAPGNWETEQFKPLDIDPSEIVTDFFTFGPTRLFVHEFPHAAEQAGNVTIYLHATVTELLCDEAGGSVTEAVIKTLDGKKLACRAKQFIIAGGGFQTPRLLLNSRNQHENGLGNEHDVVGRYYMDHGMAASGNFHPHDPKVINTLGIYDMRLMEGCSVLGKFSLSEEVMRKEGLANFCATMFPMPKPHETDALNSLKTVAIELKNRRMPEDFIGHLFKLAKGSKHLTRMMYQKIVHGASLQPGFGQGGWSKFQDNEKKYQRMELIAFVEQSPNPENRVTLIDEKDELGSQKIHVHFKWDEADLRSLSRAQDLLIEQIESTGLGRVERPEKGEDGLPTRANVGLHHLMGTTRMGDDPKKSVVDKDCKVHGVSNLHIASSSVFTTGGYANPTVTILALALRLADKLKAEMAA
ncbi:MAG: FAD-dependent oxidoreductase [Thiotrichales bacterium]